jgi:diguanylate cyclase (GGDEF)-like protein
VNRKYQVICIDDDEQFINSLASSVPSKMAPLCKDFECCFEFVTSVEELNDVISASPDAPELAMLISDQMMVGTTGVELIEKVKAKHPKIVCVLLTGHAAADSVKYAVNRHLLDQYVSKPIEDIDVFVSMVANLMKRYHINREENERTEQLARAVTQLRDSNEKIGKMLAAAKHIAALAKDLKSLEYGEVLRLGVQGAINIFKAERCVICLAPGNCPQGGSDRHQCPCAETDLISRIDGIDANPEEVIIRPDKAWRACSALGGRPPEILIPLTAGGPSGHGGNKTSKQRGFLCMCNVDPDVIASRDLLNYNASLVRDILSASLANAVLFQQVKHDSELDYLTGVKTRRVFDDMLEAEYARSLRYDHPFCVMILDVDHFKNVNDKYGHPAGDRILCEMADLLHKEKRANDVLARYGGDEFVMLAPQTNLQGALDLAERMRKRIQSSLSVEGQPVTISCGVAEWSGLKVEDVADVLRSADMALYQAKQAGRNRVKTMKAA